MISLFLRSALISFVIFIGACSNSDATNSTDPGHNTKGHVHSEKNKHDKKTGDHSGHTHDKQ